MENTFSTYIVKYMYNRVVNLRTVVIVSTKLLEWS